MKSNFIYGRKELENTLVKRNEPLINLGLARFGHLEDTGLELYNSNDDLIKKAVLSGTTIKPGLTNDGWIVKNGILSDLIKSKNLNMLKVLLSNIWLSDKVLIELYERKGTFYDVDEEFWYQLIGVTACNPRLSTSDNLLCIHGFSDFMYRRKVFAAAWNLFARLPVNNHMACLLSSFAKELLPEKPNDMDLEEVTRRWNVQATDQALSSYYVSVRCLLFGLTDKYSDNFEQLKCSLDLAARMSYYKRFTPENPSEIQDCFEKDGEAFLEEALKNDYLYRMDKLRYRLQKCCFNVVEDEAGRYPHVFNLRETDLSRKNPLWFSNEERPCIEEVEKPLSLIEAYLKLLESKYNKINRKIDKLYQLESKNRILTFSKISGILNRVDLMWICFVCAIIWYFLIR